jgi:hypothetical protein
MPQVGFKPTIPMFERAKTIHALEHAATVIGFESPYWIIIQNQNNVPLNIRVKQWEILE